MIIEVAGSMPCVHYVCLCENQFQSGGRSHHHHSHAHRNVKGENLSYCEERNRKVDSMMAVVSNARSV